jgi:uncharacterized protein YkwD
MFKRLLIVASLLAPLASAFADTMSDFEEQINIARTQAGLNVLVNDPALTCTARMHSNDIGERRVCSVEPRDGSSIWELAKKCGTASYGMIIGCGYMNPKDTVQGWVGRQDTKDMLMNPAYRTMGVAMLNNFWVVFFGW